MLLEKKDFENEEYKSKLQWSNQNHESTWEHYVECYKYTISILINGGLETKGYFFNPRSRPILFLLRHSFELVIKNKLSIRNEPIPPSHNFNTLLTALSKVDNIPQEFIELLSIIDKDNDGSCYRYYQKKNNGSPFFPLNNLDRIVLSDFIKKYDNVRIHHEELGLENLFECYNYDNNEIVWNMTLHLYECDNIGQIRHQYDEIIEFLLDGILKGKYDINKVYLPLLFLVRHSLELALKAKK